MIKYKYFPKGSADVNLVRSFLVETDSSFRPKLSERLSIEEYAQKICDNAELFMAYSDKICIGFGATYFNLFPEYSFGTMLVVHPQYRGEEFIGPKLFDMQLEFCRANNSRGYRFEVRASNKHLVKYYQRIGFTIDSEFKYPNLDEMGYYMSLKFNSK